MKSRTTSWSHSHHGRHQSHAEHGAAAREHYRREKARRARRPMPHSDILEAAKREYQALLEAEAAKGKGGRPKKKVPAKTTREDEAPEE